MNMFLDTSLDSVNMGNDQTELSEWVENDKRWLAFVDNVNTSKLLKKDPDSDYPTAESLELVHKILEFHPDDLLTEACEALSWNSVPQTGGFEMNFYLEEKRMSKKTLQDLKDDLKQVHSSQAVQALEDGKFLGEYDVTQEQVEDLHHSYNEAISKKINAIHDFVWERLLKITEEFHQKDIGSPGQLSSIMVEYATFLALGTAPASKHAYDLIAESIEDGRKRHERTLVEDNKPQDSDIVLAIHPETSDETLAKAKKHLANIYPDSAFVMSDTVTLGDDYLKRGVHAMTPIVDGECGVMDFDEHGNLVEEDNTQ